RAPEPQALNTLCGPAYNLARETWHAGHTGIEQDPVYVHATEARAETVIADRQDARTAPFGHLAEESDCVVESAQHEARRLVPCGVFDAGFIHIQVAPSTMLKRVKVLELHHKDRPVLNESVGEKSTLRAAAEALSGERRILRELFEALWSSLPKVAQGVSR